MSKGGGGGGYQYIPTMQSQQSTSNTSSNIPAWLTAASQRGVNNATDLLTGTTPYTGQLTPSTNQDQIDAGNLIRQNVGAYMPVYGQAANHINASTQAIDPSTYANSLSGINQYMNPYISNVISAAQSAGQQALGNNLNTLRDSAIRNGAAFGSRHAVQEGAAAEQNALDQQNFAANMLNQGYGQALNQMGSDITAQNAAQQQNRANSLAGGQALSTLAGQANTSMTGGISDLLQYGTQMYGQDAAAKNAQYQEFIRQQTDPLTRQQVYNQTISSAPHDTSGTASTSSSGYTMNPVQQQTSSPIMTALGAGLGGLSMLGAMSNPMSSLGMGVGALGSVGKMLSGGSILPGNGYYSDENAKTNIEKLGKDPQSGLDMYAYDYKADVKAAKKSGSAMPPKRVGPMAQNIERANPGATRKVGGKMVVNSLAGGRKVSGKGLLG